MSQNDNAAKKTGSLKDDIIGRIKEQEETRSAAPPPPRPPANASRNIASPSGVGIRKMAEFCRQLATLIDVGIPLLRSLQILAERSSSKVTKKVASDLASRVEQGQPLSTAMMANPSFFSPAFINVVRTGEAGGILEDSLRRLADMLEKRAELKRRVVGALVYPMVALLVEIIVLCVVVFYALPKLMEAYPKPEELPAITLGLLRFSNFVVVNWIIMLIGVIAVCVIVWAFFRSRTGQNFWQSLALRLPVVGNLSRKINVARFSRTLGSLTSAGIPLLDALQITAETSDNVVVERTLWKVRDSVERGGKMEEPMRSEPIFDPFVVDMVMVGDESGALDTMLLKIADSYETDVDISLKTLTSILEPILIVMLGVAVLFLALAVFLPYFKLVNVSSIEG